MDIVRVMVFMYRGIIGVVLIVIDIIIEIFRVMVVCSEMNIVLEWV